MRQSLSSLVLVFDRAHAAGIAAARAHQPIYGPYAVCGFAWITIHPGTSAAAKYAKAHFQAHPAHRGGMQISVGLFNQSMERKERYADAFARVLQEAGIRADAGREARGA
jgi:hypothetical protein